MSYSVVILFQSCDNLVYRGLCQNPRRQFSIPFIHPNDRSSAKSAARFSSPFLLPTRADVLNLSVRGVSQPKRYLCDYKIIYSNIPLLVKFV